MAKKSTKLEELHDVFKENDISFRNIELSTKVIEEIKENADAVPDYRHPSYTKHLLGDIIMIVFFAMLANANEWSEIETFAIKKEKWLRQYLELPYGVPTDDTLRIVISNIDTGHFFNVTAMLLLHTVDEILTAAGKDADSKEKTVTAVDGKESCGSKRKRTNKNENGVKALHTLNVFSCEYGMCIAQKFISEKTNEIPAAQELLKVMDLRGTIVTADAMNCQKDTVSVIAESKGDYVLALKGNQQLFYEEVKRYFDEETIETLEKKDNCYYRTVEKEHGGIAERKYYITNDVGWFCEKDKWKKLKTFGMVHKTFTDADGKSCTEDRYYICSIDENVREFERAARGHWGVENNLHWQLDFTFKDDKNTSMAKTSAKNLQIMKKIVLSVLQLVKGFYKISMKRIRYELSLDFESGVEKLFSMLDIESVKNALNSKGGSV